MTTRECALHSWLNHIFSQQTYSLSLLTGDASFRKYYRINHLDKTYVLMDAPPEQEPLSPFLTVADLLNAHGISVPKIEAVDIRDGFILMEDLGDMLFQDNLTAATADQHYESAIRMLLTMQAIPSQSINLPVFDHHNFLTELQLFIDWFCQQYLALNLADHEKSVLTEQLSHLANQVANQPKCFVHRDYHSRNIMVRTQQPLSLTTIDFQDAMIGPYTYDLVSLLKDCYLDWPEDQVSQWCQYYFEQSHFKSMRHVDQFMFDVQMCGLQRHLRILGTFSRLYLRDGKSRYLEDMPRIMRYIESTLSVTNQYPKLQQFFSDKVRLP